MTNRKSPTSFPMSWRWTAYVVPKPPIRLLRKFRFARWCHFMYLWSNTHHNYVPDFTPAFRLSVCHTGDPRLNGLISKCLLYVRCALAVRGSGPTCIIWCCVNGSVKRGNAIWVCSQGSLLWRFFDKYTHCPRWDWMLGFYTLQSCVLPLDH